VIEIEIEGKGKKESKEYGKYDKYEVESWVDTITKAEELKMDDEKMKYIKMCMDKKMKATESAYSSIDDLRKKVKEIDAQEDEEYES